MLNCTKVQTKKERVGRVMTSEKKGKKGAKFAQVHIPAFLPDVPGVRPQSWRNSTISNGTTTVFASVLAHPTEEVAIVVGSVLATRARARVE